MVQQYRNLRITNPVTQNSVPIISTGLDSVKQYQFEVYINIPNLNNIPGTKPEQLVLAAHRVQSFGMETDIIEVNRVNDKLYYPGKAKMDAITIDFDDQYLQKNGAGLWNYMTKIYDPLTGVAISPVTPGGSFKIPSMRIIELKNDMTPYSETTLYGVFPMSWKSGELNYNGTSTFHTITMTFRYDFMSHTNV